MIKYENLGLLIRFFLVSSLFLNLSCQLEADRDYFPDSLEFVPSKYNVEDHYESNTALSNIYKSLIKSTNDSVPYFVFEEDTSKSFVKLNVFETGHYRQSLVLNIDKDLIYFNSSSSRIDKLDSILPLHYFKNDSVLDMNIHKKHAFVLVKVDTSATLGDLKKMFHTILKSYKTTVEVVNDSTDLTIKWNWINFMPPPPEPPKGN